MSDPQSKFPSSVIVCDVFHLCLVVSPVLSCPEYLSLSSPPLLEVCLFGLLMLLWVPHALYVTLFW